MEYLWLILIMLTMVVYPVILVRSALKGRRWAVETLEAMRYLGGDMMTPSIWHSLKPEPDRPQAPPEQAAEEPGRLVA